MGEDELAGMAVSLLDLMEEAELPVAQMVQVMADAVAMACVEHDADVQPVLQRIGERFIAYRDGDLG